MLARRLIAAADPVTTWREEHDHDLRTATEMKAALAARLVVIHEVEAPYFYRYLAPLVHDHPKAVHLLHWLRAEEAEFARRGRCSMLGRRFVARVTVAGESTGS